MRAVEDKKYRDLTLVRVELSRSEPICVCICIHLHRLIPLVRHSFPETGALWQLGCEQLPLINHKLAFLFCLILDVGFGPTPAAVGIFRHRLALFTKGRPYLWADARCGVFKPRSS